VAVGSGVHESLAGRQEVRVGDVVLLRPGVWHGYDDCRGLELYNCCFSGELLRRELAWTREDPLLESRLAYGWTLTELAELLHLAPGYLVRLFKAATGVPPMAYLARLRAEHAATLLLHSDQPVTGIGQAVGWPDQNYFARRFRAHYGLSATTYRAQFAASASHLQRDWRDQRELSPAAPAGPAGSA
jgi:AraC-like DNA-binding protein